MIPHSIGTEVPMTAYLHAKYEIPEQFLTPKEKGTFIISRADGYGTFLVDTEHNELSYHIEYSGLVGTETAAHIHGFAPAGMNAAVLEPLPAGKPKIGVWEYDESEEEEILAGLTYVNVHTDNYPTGEIRGQIVPII